MIGAVSQYVGLIAIQKLPNLSADVKVRNYSQKFYKKYLQNVKYNVKRAFVLHLNFGFCSYISSSLNSILSINC